MIDTKVTFEHKVISHRGPPNDYTAELLCALGAQGFRVCAAYALPDGASTLPVHYYVLSRVIPQAPAEEIKASAPPTPAKRGDRR